MAKNMKIRRGNDGFSYPYTSPDLVIDENGKSNTKKFEEIEYSKADKNEVFTMANMGQDIKEAMTGGSVAVVGKNTILEENITNKQITPYKTNFIQYGNNLLDTDSLISGYLYSDGNIKNGNYKTTTYIPFTNTDKINLSRMDKPEINKLMTRRAIRTACFYDSSYNLLSDFYYDNTDLIKESITYQGSGNVAYIRVSIQSLLIDNAMLYLGEERTEYEKNGVIINKLKLNENLKEEIETKIKIDNNVLKDKTIINFGDSIGAGDGNNGVGYAELLAKKNDMTCYDYAVGGATITTSTNDILTQIEKAKNDKKTADYILFDGFTNDINNGAVKELGKISDGYSQTKDINTFSGAFEEICFRLKSYWKGIPIFYVCVHKMSSRDTELQNTYSTRAKTLCERWSIPVIDIYNEGGLNTYIADYKALYTNNADGTHPNELGYNTFYVSLIEKKLKGGITSSANIKADNIKIEDANNNFTSTNVEGALEEVSAQFKDIAKKIESGNISNNVEPQLMDMPRIYFSEGTLPTTKTATMMRFDYYSKTAEYHGWAEIKCQGNSSMSYPKKNFTIKLYKDKAKTEKLKIDFKGWGKQSKFVLKANWIDITHARNIVSARIWGDIVKSRSDYANLPELLRTSPNQGAIDGFPIVVYGNGYYQGRYTLNIPKDKWMSNMDDTLNTHCILCGENYYSGCFRVLPQIDGTDWTDELHDVVPATIKTSWTNAIKFVMNSTDVEFKNNLSNYFNVDSLIDYLLYGILSTGLDAFGKNQIYLTYDAQTWLGSMYDMDSTWGLHYTGQKILANDYPREQYEDYVSNTSNHKGNLLYIRLQKLFINEIKARYAELKQTIFTYPYLVNRFEEFVQICPSDIVKEDYSSTTGNGTYTNIPSTTTNNIQQIRANIKARLEYMDSYINGLVESKPCTAINLNNSTLTFATGDSQTLTTTLTPSDTTDDVVWSVSPLGICTVENGIVTPVSNGECIITAKCGEQTATCNVTVRGIVKHYTVTNNLTKCTTSNTTTTIEENSSYSATITANEGCILGTVVITMGGNNITSSSYADGVITIENVTGDIVINITANMQEVDYTNPVYTLPQATTFDGVDNYIDTGIQLFDTNKDFSIFIDFSDTGYSQSNQATVLHCMYEGNIDSNLIYPGIALSVQWNNDAKYGSLEGNYILSNTVGSYDNMKILIEKNTTDNKINIYENDELKYTTALSAKLTCTIDKHLLLGCYQTIDGTKGRFWKGVMNQCKIWFRNLSDSEKNELFS